MVLSSDNSECHCPSDLKFNEGLGLCLGNKLKLLAFCVLEVSPLSGRMIFNYNEYKAKAIKSSNSFTHRNLAT